VHEPRIVGDVPRHLDRLLANAPSARSAPAIGVGPSEIQVLEIASFNSGAGDSANAPGRVVFRQPHPGHPIAAIFDHHRADGLSQRLLVLSADHVVITKADRAKHAIQLPQALWNRLCRSRHLRRSKLPACVTMQRSNFRHVSVGLWRGRWQTLVVAAAISECQFDHY